MRLNLGCGNKIIDGWVNVDLYHDDPRIIKMDIRKLDYPDNSADEIWAEHCIEHCSYKETPEILREWARVLKPEGKITIITNNLDVTFKNWLEKGPKYWIALRNIYGSHENEGQIHYAGFCFDYLKMLMVSAGFTEIKEQVADYPTHLWVEATK